MLAATVPANEEHHMNTTTVRRLATTAAMCAAFAIAPIACGDDDDARTAVMELIIGIPDLRAFDGGSLVNAVGIEAFAAMLLTINLRHRGKAALRLLGVEGYAHPEPPA
jgi:predicted dinucleotide-binding enzyme